MKSGRRRQISPEEVWKTRRDLAIYLLRYVRGERLEMIGKEFNLSNYSSVSNAISRVKRKLHSNKFKKLYGKIYDSL